MRLPANKRSVKTVERVLCGKEGIFGDSGVIYAENMDLSFLPTLAPRKPRTRLQGLTGNILQFFSNGERVCIIMRNRGAYSARIFTPGASRLETIALNAPRSEAFLHVHVWRGARLYLPAFSAVIDTDALSVFYVDRPLVAGEAELEYDQAQAAKKRHVVYFLDGDLEQYLPGESVLVEYSYFEAIASRKLFLRIVSVDAESGAITLEGEGAPDLVNSDPGTVQLRYDIPALVGVFGDHERLYGFERNCIYVSAKGEESFCFTPHEIHDVAHAAVKIELDAEVTGGCMYKGKPCFFTDGAVVWLFEDAELGFRVSVIPTVGVTPKAVSSPAVIGDKICYFSRHGLSLFDGKRGRVVRADLTAPQGGAAVADGRFYTFFATGTEGDALYAYDPESDLLYSLGSNEKIDVSFALGSVLIGIGGTATRLVVFAEEDSLPYPISAMVESGVLTKMSESSYQSVLRFGKDRLSQGEFSPFAVLLDAELSEGATLTLELWCDEGETPIHSFTLQGALPRKVHELLCYPRHCQSYHVRVCGEGDFRVFDIRTQRRV